jgi:hypothetical protein
MLVLICRFHKTYVFPPSLKKKLNGLETLQNFAQATAKEVYLTAWYPALFIIKTHSSVQFVFLRYSPVDSKVLVQYAFILHYKHVPLNK